MGFSTQDIAILGIALLATAAYYFVYAGKKTRTAIASGNGLAKAAVEASSSTGRDFVAAMEKAVSCFCSSRGHLNSPSIDGLPSAPRRDSLVRVGQLGWMQRS